MMSVQKGEIYLTEDKSDEETDESNEETDNLITVTDKLITGESYHPSRYFITAIICASYLCRVSKEKMQNQQF
jgi:hypothetical protein